MRGLSGSRTRLLLAPGSTVPGSGLVSLQPILVSFSVLYSAEAGRGAPANQVRDNIIPSQLGSRWPHPSSFLVVCTRSSIWSHTHFAVWHKPQPAAISTALADCICEWWSLFCGVSLKPTRINIHEDYFMVSQADF